MGINGLLPLLKSIHKSCHLKNFEGKTLGIDAYGWLHRGIVACALELATGKLSTKFVDFAMHRVRMLQHFGVNPLLVFDGDYLPSKAATEKERARRREDHRKLGQCLLKDGKLAQAHFEFQKSLDVTPEMARQLIDELRKCKVQYIVAPYEADCQMVYLETKGIISGIISEDSDLLVFGAKCLLTKLDQYGNCIEINKADFSACKDINLAGWSDTAFRQMAILSGCDYLPSINKMGLKTSYRMIRRYKNIEKVIQMLQFDGKFHVPKGYLESFYQAELTFLHQRVFCPQALGLVLHTQPVKPIDLDNMPFIGAFVDPNIAQGVARGDLHPTTKLPFVISDNTPISWSESPWSTTTLSKQTATRTKKELSIANFFSKRSLLTELDNSSVKPSTQHRLLGKKLSRPAFVPVSYSRTFQEEIKVQQISTATSEEINSSPTVARASDISKRNSVKRARLCADTDSYSQSESSKLHSSPYFSTKIREDINSLVRNNRVEQKITQDNYLFSDDSIEDAMLAMSNLCEDTQSEPNTDKISLNDKESGEGYKYNVRSTNSQPLIGSSINVEEISSSLPSHSMKSLDNLPPTPPQENSAPFSNSPKDRLEIKLRTTPKLFTKRICSMTPQSSKQSETSTFLPKTQTSRLHHNSKATKKSMESCQKFSTPTTSLSRLPFESSNTPPESSGAVKSQILWPQHAKKIPIQSANLDIDYILKLADEENVFQNSSAGSEDLIIPDSEEESLSPIFTGKLTDYFG